MIACRYFDGATSRPWPVSAEAVGAALHVVGEDLDRTVEPAALSFSPATDRGPARIVFADGALCEFDDRDAARVLFEQLGHRPAATDRLVSNTRRVVAVTVAFIAVMAAIWQWGIPLVSDLIVERAPQRWNDAMGDGILQTLDERRFFRPTGLSPAVRDRVFDRFRTLKPLPGAPDVQIVFRKLGSPNALALPGGTIVVSDELVLLARGDDDALATVLAHEVGHEAHRDALRQLVRSTITSALAAWYFGDVSSTVAVAAGGIGTLTYSRDAEHEADLYALRTMRANGVSTKPAADLFRRLETWQPPLRRRPADEVLKDDGTSSAGKAARLRIPEYLSTHPDTGGRIELFEHDGVVDPTTR